MAKIFDINNIRKADLFWLIFIPKAFDHKYFGMISREWEHAAEELIYLFHFRQKSERRRLTNEGIPKNHPMCSICVSGIPSPKLSRIYLTTNSQGQKT